MSKKSKRARCKNCGAPIRFAITPARKAIALDDSSDPQGTYSLHLQRNYSTGELESVATPLTAGQRDSARSNGQLLFLAHAASCPDTERPRKKPDPDYIKALVDSLDLPEPSPRRAKRVRSIR